MHFVLCSQDPGTPPPALRDTSVIYRDAAPADAPPDLDWPGRSAEQNADVIEVRHFTSLL